MVRPMMPKKMVTIGDSRQKRLKGRKASVATREVAAWKTPLEFQGTRLAVTAYKATDGTMPETPKLLPSING